MSGLERAHKLISLLVTPTETPAGTSVFTWFTQLITSKNNEYVNEVDGAIQLCGDVTFDFVRCCVNALVNLQLELARAVAAAAPPPTTSEADGSTQAAGSKSEGSKPRLEPDALSIAQQKNVNSLLQMIVSLGILPNLIPGIGMQPEKRSDFLADIIRQLPERKILEKYKQLVFSLDSLLDFSKHRSLSTLVMTRHLTDILAALVQVSSAPLSKPAAKPPITPEETKGSQTVDTVSKVNVIEANGQPLDLSVKEEDVFVMTEDLYDRLSRDQIKYKSELMRVVEKTYQPTIVRCLLSLQTSAASSQSGGANPGQAKKMPKPPRWFTKKVSELLSSRLLVPADSGVSNVIRGVLDFGGGDLQDNMDWKKIDLVAKLLSSPPEGPYAKIEHYYQMICPQIIRLIDDREDRLVQMIACASVKTVSERSLILSRRYLHNVILEPFIKLADIPAEAKDTFPESVTDFDESRALAVAEAEIDECLKRLYKIYVIGNDPSLLFLANLEQVMPILLELHTAIAYGASHLCQPVKMIILKYLKHTTRSTGIAVLRAFALNLTEIKEMNNNNKDSSQTRNRRILRMHKDVAFAAGDEGGVKVISKADKDKSIFLEDDERAITVQDLLEELKDGKTSVDFFLSLMQDLTLLASQEDEDLGDKDEIVEEGLERRLADLEIELDQTMDRMRRNLMVIRLVGLLSEDVTLQDQLMSESKRMIEFLGNAIRRAAFKLKRKQAITKDEEEDDVVEDTMAIQSLNMALTILSVHLTQADVKICDWEDMQQYSPDLEILASHSDTRISKIATQLNALVLTHGTILKEQDNIRKQTKKIEEETVRIREKAAEIKRAKKELEDKQLDERKQQIKQKAEELKKAKEERRKNQEMKDKSFNAEVDGACGGLDIQDDAATEMKILEDKSGMSEYEAALYDISDPLLPVRGHGLIQLARLVERKDEETLKNIDKVVKLSISSLEDGDTYVYLSAINALVECSRHRTDAVMDTLTKEFLCADQRKRELGATMADVEAKRDDEMALRTKVGEALVRVTKELGDLTPHYKNQLLNAFFSASSDPDEMVRASSLSNLGEVCKNLRWSLGSITGELMAHLEHCSRDTSVEVRRAAGLVLTLTLQGLGSDALRILESSIRDIYRALKLRLATEKDEAALVHINLALDEIDRIVTELFVAPALANQHPEKRIYVLDTPPDL